MNPKRLTLSLVLALAMSALALAFEVPQSRQQFVKAVVDGARGSTVDKVYPLLEEKATACLDVTVKRTAYVGYVERSSSDYSPTVRRTEIVLYRSSIGVKMIVASLNDWFAGDPSPCPRLK